MQTIQTTVKALSKQGHGVGEWTDPNTKIKYSVFVPFSAPGDEVEVEIQEKNKRYMHAKIKQIIKRSAGRVDPPCPVFARCGGCQFLHISYETQLKEKQQMIEHIFKRVDANNKVKPIIASPKHHWYRHRAIFHTMDNGMYGLKQYHSEKIIPTRQCWLVHSTINEELLIPSQGKAPKKQFTVSADGKNLEKGDTGQYTIEWNNRTFHLEFGTDCFIQSNIEANKILVAAVCDNAAAKNKNILDLYCGIGNFTIPLGSAAKHVVGVEGSKSSADWAQKNTAANNDANIEIIQASVIDAIKKMIRNSQKFDTIILDPPRSGAEEIIPLLPRLQAKNIIYVGCEIDAMIEDLKALKKDHYEIESVIPIDMFPQTAKIECVVKLVLGK